MTQNRADNENNRLLYALCLVATFLIMVIICFAYVAIKICAIRMKNLEQTKINSTQEYKTNKPESETSSTTEVWRIHDQNPHEKSQAEQFEELQKAWEKVNRRTKAIKGVN